MAVPRRSSIASSRSPRLGMGRSLYIVMLRCAKKVQFQNPAAVRQATQLRQFAGAFQRRGQLVFATGLAGRLAGQPAVVRQFVEDDLLIAGHANTCSRCGITLSNTSL